MRGLNLTSDRGAISPLVAVFVVVLTLPLLVFVIDVGGIYTERRDLQNSASSGARAAALVCVEALSSGTDCDPSDARDEALDFATANDKQGVDLPAAWPCGTVPGLSPCPAPSGSLYGCASAPPAGTVYVEVYVTSSGAGWDPLIARGADVQACARAEISVPTGLTSMAFTVSGCEWNLYTADRDGDGERDYGPYSSAPREYPLVIQEGKGGATVRPASCAAADENAGAFGWLEELDPDGDCEAHITDGTYHGDPGASIVDQDSCVSALQDAYASHEPIYFPIYETYNKDGKTYKLRGFAAFVVTAFSVQGGAKVDRTTSWLTGVDVSKKPDNGGICGSAKCVVGYFTQDLVAGTGSGGTDRGVMSVRMIL